MFKSEEIIEAYKNNDIVIGEDYIQIAGKREEFGDLHIGAVQYIQSCITEHYYPKTPKRRTIRNCSTIYDIRMIEDKNNLEFPYTVVINNSDWYRKFKDFESADKYYNKMYKLFRKNLIKRG